MKRLLLLLSFVVSGAFAQELPPDHLFRQNAVRNTFDDISVVLGADRAVPLDSITQNINRTDLSVFFLAPEILAADSQIGLSSRLDRYSELEILTPSVVETIETIPEYEIQLYGNSTSWVIQPGSPLLSYSTNTFIEAGTNNGGISNVVNLTLTLDTFTTVGTMTQGVDYTVTNLPAGLTPSLISGTGTTATFSLTGTATTHENSDDVADLTLTFTDAAFTNNVASAVINSEKTDLIIDFEDAIPSNASLAYVGDLFGESVANDGSVSNSLTINLTDDTFDFVGVLTPGTHFNSNNIPAGLTATITTSNATTAVLSLTGNASAHEDANDAANLQIIFLDDAFTNSTAAQVTNSTKSDISIDFDNAVVSLAYDAGTFTEVTANDGSTTDVLTLTLTNDTLVVPGGAMTVSTHYTVSNVPPGMTAVVTGTSSTTATLALSGSAGSHENANDVSDLTLTFLDAAFTNSIASVVVNATKSDIIVDFTDAAALTYVGDTFDEAGTNDGSINNSLTVTLAGDTFTTTGALASGTDFNTANVPAGLSPSVTTLSGTTAIFALSGTATDHENSDDVNDLTLTFLDNVFTLSDAAEVVNFSNSGLNIDFDDEIIAGGGFLNNWVTPPSARAEYTAGEIAAIIPSGVGAFTFPAPYGTQAVRLTDTGLNDGNGYSYWSDAFIDGSGVMHVIYKASTGAEYITFNTGTLANPVNNGKILPGADPRVNYHGEDYEWNLSGTGFMHYTDGALTLRSYNPLTSTQGTDYDLESLVGTGKNLWQMSYSRDGGIVAGTVRTGSTEEGCMAYRKSDGSYYYYAAAGVGTFDECQISQDGRYLLIKDNVNALDQHDNPIVFLPQTDGAGNDWASLSLKYTIDDQDGAGGHSDMTSAGMVMSDNWDIHTPPGSHGNALYVWDLDQADLTALQADKTEVFHTGGNFGIEIPEHVTTRNDGTFWCAGSDNLGTGFLDGELFCGRMDGGDDILVVAPTLTIPVTQGADYANAPKPSLTPDGTWMLWRSNVGGNEFQNDLFAVKVPSNLLFTPATPTLIYSGSTFTESVQNNGGLSNSVIITLTNDTFAVTGDMTVSTHYTVANVPAGLTPVINASNSTTASITFAGTATDHENADDVSDFTVTFLDAAFTNSTAAQVTDSTKSDFAIDFEDAASGGFTAIDWTGETGGAADQGQGTIDCAGACNPAGGYSVREYASGTAEFEYEVMSTTFAGAIGLDAVWPGHSNLIDFAWQPTGSGIAEIRVNNVYRDETSIAVSDVLKISTNGTTTNFLKNDVVIHAETATTPSYPIRVDAHFGGPGAFSGVVASAGGAGSVQPEIALNTTSLSEAGANDGTITQTIAVTLTDDTFVTTGNLTGTHFSTASVPLNFTVVVNASTTTAATISLTGTAADHENADDTNFTLSFLDAAFTLSDADEVSNAENISISLDFDDPVGGGALTYASGTFSEAGANDGTITETINVTLATDTFVNPLTSGVHYTPSNAPTGLTFVATYSDANTAILSLTGTAAAHADADDISNLGIDFLDAAFTNSTAAQVTNSTKLDFVVNFDDPSIAVIMGRAACPSGDLTDPTDVACARLIGSDPTDVDDVVVYAGDNPGDTEDLFIRRCDNGMTWDSTGGNGDTLDDTGCTGTRTNLAWKDVGTESATANVSSNDPWTDTGLADGIGNTALLVADATGTHEAAEACNNLGTGWFLPAASQLDLAYANLIGTDDPEHPLATFNNGDEFDTSSTVGPIRASFLTTSGSYYWTSSEASATSGAVQRFTDGNQVTNGGKTSDRMFRCAYETQAAPSASISYSGDTFDEDVADDGTIDNDLTLTLSNDTFATVGTLAVATDYTVANVPAGLTASVVTSSSTSATFSLSGTATSNDNADDISNLQLVLLDDSFTSGDASSVGNSAKSDLSIDFIEASPTPVVNYSSGTFTEAVADDGSIANTLTLTLTNDTFVISGGAMTVSTHYTVSNVPTGLTAVVTGTSTTTATFTLTGTASAHANANDISNLELAFLDAAFTVSTAAQVTNATKSDVVVDFIDSGQVTTQEQLFQYDYTVDVNDCPLVTDYPWGAQITDWDDSGTNDIVIFEHHGVGDACLFADGALTGTAFTGYLFGGVAPNNIDRDNDGDLDVNGSEAKKDIYWRNDGSGTYVEVSPIWTPNNYLISDFPLIANLPPGSAMVGHPCDHSPKMSYWVDLDDDDINERIVNIYGCFNQNIQTDARRGYVFKHDGSDWEDDTPTVTTDRDSILFPDDYDLDGDIDIVNLLTGKIYDNNGSGVFTESSNVLFTPEANFTWNSPARISGDGYLQHIDIDNNGYKDYVYAGDHKAEGIIILNLGGGTFSELTGSILGSSGRNAKFGDLDGDGDYDMYRFNESTLEVDVYDNITTNSGVWASTSVDSEDHNHVFASGVYSKTQNLDFSQTRGNILSEVVHVGGIASAPTFTVTAKTNPAVQATDVVQPVNYSHVWIDSNLTNISIDEELITNSTAAAEAIASSTMTSGDNAWIEFDIDTATEFCVGFKDSANATSLANLESGICLDSSDQINYIKNGLVQIANITGGAITPPTRVAMEVNNVSDEFQIYVDDISEVVDADTFSTALIGMYIGTEIGDTITDTEYFSDYTLGTRNPSIWDSASLVGTMVNIRDLENNSTVGGAWAEHAHSSVTINSGQDITLTFIDNLDRDRIAVGLDTDWDGYSTWTDLEFGIMRLDNDTFQTISNGSLTNHGGVTTVTGQVPEIRLIDGVVTYYYNGVLIHTDVNTPTFPLKVVATVDSASGVVYDANLTITTPTAAVPTTSTIELYANNTTINAGLNANVTSTSTELVTVGIPFAACRLYDPADFRLFDDGASEVSVYVETTLEWPATETCGVPSIRALKVQFEYDATGVTSDTYTWDLNGPRTPADRTVAAVSEVANDGNKAGVMEPRVFAINDPAYVVGTGLNPPTLIAATNDHDDDYFPTMFTRFGEGLDYDTTLPSNWLFDRTSALYRQGSRTGNVLHYREAYNSHEFYIDKIEVTGNNTTVDEYCVSGFDFGGIADTFSGGGSGCDSKYIYAQNLLLHLALTGDDSWSPSDNGTPVARLVDLEDTVLEMANLLYLGTNRCPSLASCQTPAVPPAGFSEAYDEIEDIYTERKAGLGLQTMLAVCQMTLDTTVCSQVDTIIDNMADHQSNNPDGLGDFGYFGHSLYLHEGGLLPWVGNVETDFTSSTSVIINNHIADFPNQLTTGNSVRIGGVDIALASAPVFNGDGTWTLTLDTAHTGTVGDIVTATYISGNAGDLNLDITTDRMFSPWMQSNIADGVWDYYHWTNDPAQQAKAATLLEGMGNSIAAYAVDKTRLSATTETELESVYSITIFDSNLTLTTCSSVLSDSPLMRYFGADFMGTETLNTDFTSHTFFTGGYADQHTPEALFQLSLGAYFETNTARRNAMWQVATDIQEWYTEHNCTAGLVAYPARAFSWQEKPDPFGTYLWVKQELGL